MTFADLVDALKMMVAGLTAGLPVVGTLFYFQRERNDRFDRIDKSHVELAKQVNKLDTDFDGLTRQLGGVVKDVEQRFLTRDEHAAAVNRLDASIVELNRTLVAFSRQMFELARDRRGASS